MTSDDRFNGEPVERLYKRLVPRLVNYARRYFDLDDSRGIADLSFMKAYRGFKPSTGAPFDAFAFMVLRGECVEEIRRRTRAPRTISMDEAGTHTTESRSDTTDIEGSVASNEGAKLRLEKLLRAIDTRYATDEHLRGLHRDVVQHLVISEFRPERLDSPELQALAARWNVTPQVVSQARARIKQLFIEILRGDD